MKELFNRLIALHKSGGKMQEASLPKEVKQNVSPKWIDTLKENEIIVFGYNEDRDEPTTVAVKRFGHVLSKMEDPRSKYIGVAISFLYGGYTDTYTDELNRLAVESFVDYAVNNPQLHFIVTDEGWPPIYDIAQMFYRARQLPNVSLPRSFWNEYNLLNIQRPSFLHKPSTLYEKLMAIYKYYDLEYGYGWRILWEDPRIYIFKHLNSPQIYLVNGDTKEVIEMIDRCGNVKIFSCDDIKFDAIANVKHRNQLLQLQAPNSIGVMGFKNDGISLVRWGVGGLNKFGCSNAHVDGYIDTDFRIVVPFQHIADPFHEDYFRLAKYNRDHMIDKKSIWR